MSLVIPSPWVWNRSASFVMFRIFVKNYWDQIVGPAATILCSVRPLARYRHKKRIDKGRFAWIMRTDYKDIKWVYEELSGNNLPIYKIHQNFKTVKFLKCHKWALSLNIFQSWANRMVVSFLAFGFQLQRTSPPDQLRNVTRCTWCTANAAGIVSPSIA